MLVANSSQENTYADLYSYIKKKTETSKCKMFIHVKCLESREQAILKDRSSWMQYISQLI